MILESGAHYPIPPQAFAETAPQFWPSYFVPRLGMTLETAFASYGQLYRVQPWVYAAVQKVAGSIARLGVNVGQSPKTGQVLDKESPFSKLMANPCPTMAPSPFWGGRSGSGVYGESYWIKLREGRGQQVTGFIPMHPSLTQIFRDQDGTETYRFMGQPNKLLPADDVVAFRSFNPDNTMRGMSRLEPLRLTLLNEDSSRRAMAASWKNGARPSGWISSERELGLEGRAKLKVAFQSEHQGSGNAGRVVVLEDGVTFTPAQYNAQEMAYIETRKLDRDEVAAVMDLPPASIGGSPTSRFPLSRENMRGLYRDSMAPRIEFMESVVNWQVATEFNGPKVRKFAVAEVLRGALEQRAAAAGRSWVQTLVTGPSGGAPVFPGFEPDAGPDADKLYGQGALAPIERLAAPEPAPTGFGAEPRREQGAATGGSRDGQPACVSGGAKVHPRH